MIRLKRSYFEIACYVLAVIVSGVIFFNEYHRVTELLRGLMMALGPFLVGFTIAYVLNRPLKWMEFKLQLPRLLAVPLLYVVILIVVSGFIYYYLPQVLENGGAVINALVVSVNNLIAWANQNDYVSPLLVYVQRDFGGFAEFISTTINRFMAQTSAFVLDLTGIFLNLFLGTIISLYMLFGKERQIGVLRKGVQIIFKEKAHAILNFLGEVNKIFSQFISGLIVEAIIVGILAYIIFLLLGVRYGLILALIIMCMNVIPYLGPVVSAIPAILTTLTYDPMKALWVALLLLVLQQFDGNYIGPKVMGSFIGMEPIWVIFSISIGAGVGGVFGILMAIPIAAIVKIVWLKAIDEPILHTK